MTRYFLDTSALAKRYHREAGTAQVMEIFRISREVRISSLSLVEFQSVFAGKVRAGVIDRAAAGLQRARLLVDIAAEEIELVPVSSAISPLPGVSSENMDSSIGFEHLTPFNLPSPSICGPRTSSTFSWLPTKSCSRLRQTKALPC